MLNRLKKEWWLILSLFTSLFLQVVLYGGGGFLFCSTNLIITFFSLYKSGDNINQPYSLSSVFYIFNFFFFGLVPLNDYKNNNIYWGGGALSEDSFVYANLVVLLSLFVYWFVGRFSKFKKNIISEDLRKDKINGINFGRKNLVILAILFLICYFIVSANDFNFYKLIFRGLADDLVGNLLVDSQINYLINTYYVRPMPVIFLLFYSYKYREQFLTLQYKLTSIVIFIMCIIFIAPTSVARFLAASLYFALMLNYTNFLRKPFRLQLVFLVGLLVIMPILNVFRRFDFNNYNLSFDLDFLNHGHFDAYQNLARVVDISFISYGYQLLGALFFWIPRSIWNNKPVGSGSELAEIQSYSFNNISMPFIAEGYVNFGVFGVLLFSFVLATLINRLDAKYWFYERFTNNSESVFYYLSFGLVFFMLRGDLMSSLAYYVSIFLSFKTVKLIFKIVDKAFGC